MVPLDTDFLTSAIVLTYGQILYILFGKIYYNKQISDMSFLLASRVNYYQ